MSEFDPHSAEFNVEKSSGHFAVAASIAAAAVTGFLATPGLAGAESYSYKSPQAVEGRLAPVLPAEIPPLGGKVTFGISAGCEFTCIVSPPSYNRNRAWGDMTSLISNDDARHATLETLGKAVLRTQIALNDVVHFRLANTATDNCNPNDLALDMHRVDYAVEAAANRHISLDMDIIGAPNYYGPNTNMPMTASDVYNIYCAIARRYDGRHLDGRGKILPQVVNFGARNEVNMPRNYDPTLIVDTSGKSLYKPRDAVELYNQEYLAAQAGLKKGNPNAKLSYGELSNQTGKYIISIKDWLTASDAETLKKADSLAVHYYQSVPGEMPNAAQSGEVYASSGLSKDNFYNNHQDLLKLLDSKTGNHTTPIHISETGVAANQFAPNAQAQELHQAVFLKQAMQFASDPKNRVAELANFGLLTDTTRSGPNNFQTGLVRYFKYPEILRTVHRLGFKVMARFIYRQKNQ